MHTSFPPSPISHVSLLKQPIGYRGSANFRNFEICLLFHIKLLATISNKTSLILETGPYNRVTTNEE